MCVLTRNLERGPVIPELGSLSQGHQGQKDDMVKPCLTKQNQADSERRAGVEFLGRALGCCV